MSLIYFHAVLIATAVVFSFGLGIWELGYFETSNARFDFWVGVASFIFSFMALVYLVWFVQKRLMKH